ncbi:hypothetical protein TWF506_009500 [Arthrobotrys conoides]|uniref:Uncharacterized protein n=1 Tax=Arthrobotrys conoides TaxID=74498 RepID=A0AAN8NFM2_9PEZI
MGFVGVSKPVLNLRHLQHELIITLYKGNENMTKYQYTVTPDGRDRRPLNPPVCKTFNETRCSTRQE